MVQKRISVTSEQFNHTPAFAYNLMLEVGSYHIALIAANGKQVEAFEFFDYETESLPWGALLNNIKTQSTVLKNDYASTTVFYSFKEALVVPNTYFYANKVEHFIQAVFGEQQQTQLHYQKLGVAAMPYVICSIPQKLQQAVENIMGNVTHKHSYGKIIENTLNGSAPIEEIIKVIFYPKHMVVLVINNNKLSLIQQYPYNSPEDIIYYLLNITQEFNLNVVSTPIEVSGTIDTESKHFELMVNVFSRLTLETANTNSILKDELQISNAHFYTPFLNLV